MVIINVCIGSACHLQGSYRVIKKLQSIILEKGLSNKVMVRAAFCLGECTKAVAVRVNDENIVSVTPDTVDEFFEKYIERRIKD